MEKIARRCSVQSKLLVNARITEVDIFVIWDALSYFIREELSKKKGVVVPGFGTFTFVEQRIDIGNNKEMVKLKPFFLLSEKFAQVHAVQFEKEHVNTAIPVSRVNYVAISEITKRYSREIVEAVLNEAFLSIDYFLRNEGVLAITFNGLGAFRIIEISPKPKKQAVFDFIPSLANHLPIY